MCEVVLIANPGETLSKFPQLSTSIIWFPAALVPAISAPPKSTKLPLYNWQLAWAALADALDL